MNYPFERIDGSVHGDQRQASIDRFCRPDSVGGVYLYCLYAFFFRLDPTPLPHIYIIYIIYIHIYTCNMYWDLPLPYKRLN